MLTTGCEVSAAWGCTFPADRVPPSTSKRGRLHTARWLEIVQPRKTQLLDVCSMAVGELAGAA